MYKFKVIWSSLAILMLIGLIVPNVSANEKLDYICGDVNADGNVNLLDILYMIANIYDVPPGPEPVPFSSGDANAEGILNLIDILYLVDYIYGEPQGPAPICERDFGPPGGQLGWSSSCKLFDGKADIDPVPDTLDCINYVYNSDNGGLRLDHINGALNCCPVVISEVEVINDEIIITEVDSLDNGGCACLCLFDFTYYLHNIQPGTYTIRIVEPYRHYTDEELTFTVQLVAHAEGQYCVPRTWYPWVQI